MTAKTLSILDAWEHEVETSPDEIINTPLIAELIKHPKVIGVFGYPVAVTIVSLGGDDDDVECLCALIQDAVANGISLWRATNAPNAPKTNLGLLSFSSLERS